MAPYRQSCSSCVGRSATAYHDVERYERDLIKHRTAERLALARALDPDISGSTEGSSESWHAEAAHHGELGRKAERALARARSRVLASFSVGGCVLCGGTGYVEATGTFVRGAKGLVE